MERTEIRRKIRDLENMLRRSRSRSTSESSDEPPPPKRRRRIISSDSSSSEPDNETSNVANNDSMNDKDMENLFSYLGEDPTKNKDYSEDIHSHLAVRWTHVLTKGLKKDHRSELLNNNLPPANCTFLGAPTLNEEIKAAVQEPAIKRDEKLFVKQSQLGSGITSMGRALESVFKIPDKQLKDNIIKHLGDAGQILCDLHYLESTTRQTLLAQGLNKNTKEAVKNLTRDKLLFGEGLSETLKAIKACSRSAVDLKAKTTKPTYRGSNDSCAGPSTYRTATNYSLNWRGPSRRAYSANTAGGYLFRERRAAAAPASRPPRAPPARPLRAPPTKRY